MSNQFCERCGYILIAVDGKMGTSHNTFAAQGAQLAQAIENLIKANEALPVYDPAHPEIPSSTVNPTLSASYQRSKVSFKLYPQGNSPADTTSV